MGKDILRLASYIPRKQKYTRRIIRRRLQASLDMFDECGCFALLEGFCNPITYRSVRNISAASVKYVVAMMVNGGGITGTHHSFSESPFDGPPRYIA